MAKRKTKKNKPAILKFPTQHSYNELKQLLVDALEHDSIPLDLCQTIYEDIANPGKALVDFIVSQEDQELCLAACEVLNEAFTSNCVPTHAWEEYSQGAAPAIVKAIQNPAVDDEKKLMLGNLYSRLQPNEDIHSLVMNNLNDPEAVAAATKKKFISQLKPDPISLYEFFNNFDLMNPNEDSRLDFGDHPDSIDERIKFLMNFADEAPQGFAAILAVMGCYYASRNWPLEVWFSGLDQLQAYPDPIVAWFLRELAAIPLIPSEISLKARHYANSMEKNGVTAEYQLDMEVKRRVRTQIDGSGSFSYWQTSYDPKTEQYITLSMLANDKKGIKELWITTSDDVDKMDSMLYSHTEIQLYELNQEDAKAIIQDALFKSKLAGNPIPNEYLICRSLLGSSPLEPKPQTYDLSLYQLHASCFNPDQVTQSDRLMNNRLYGNFFFSSDMSYAFMKKHAPKRGKTRLNKKKMAAYFQQVIPEEMETLLPKLENTLHFEALAQRHDQESNQIAAHTWYALKNRLIPLVEIPYIKGLADKAASYIIENIRNGFNSQEEANQASLALTDDSPMDINELRKLAEIAGIDLDGLLDMDGPI